MAVMLYRPRDIAMIGGNHYFRSAAIARTVSNMRNHGAAGKIREHFPRKPRGGVARWDNDAKFHGVRGQARTRT